MGFWGLTFVSLGSLISWIMAGIFLVALALVHAELGAAYPVSGGTARLTHFAFGSRAGFTCGWMGWLQAVTIAPIEVEAALSHTNNKIHGAVNTNGTFRGRRSN